MELIRKYLPEFEYREHNTTLVVAAPSTAYNAMRSLDFSRSWLIRSIFTAREFLYHLFAKHNHITKSPVFGSLVESALKLGWSVLEEEPNRELVVGAVTRPWETKVIFQGLSGQEFITFSKPGYAKIVWNIAVQEVKPGVTQVSTETLVTLTDSFARRKFRYYWLLFSLGIRLVRYAALRMVKRDLKTQQP